jgi:HD-GYP domain-containing protein (c-di-GMP phosphodiesterase class II)
MRSDTGKFSLTGYFAGISLLGLVAASLLMTLVFSRHNESILRTAAETQNSALTRFLGNFILPRFAGLLADAHGMTGDALRADVRTAMLRAAIIDFAKGTNVVKVKIYDPDGKLIFSSDPRQIGVVQSSNEGFLAAKGGATVSELTYRGSFDAFEGVIYDRDLMSSYVPVLDATGRIAAVFEVYSDISELVRQMEATRLRVVLIVGTPMLILFAVLLYFIRRADGLILAQRTALESSTASLEAQVVARTGELSAANRQLSDKVGELEHAEESIRKASGKFQHMLEIQQRMCAELDLDLLVPMAMQEISRYMDADRSSLFLFDWKTMQLSSKFAQGVAGNMIVIPLKMGIVGTAILNRKTYNVSNAYEHPYFNPDLDQVLSFRTESILVVPMVDAAGRVHGGIQLLNKSTGRFSLRDERIVEEAATGLAGEIAGIGFEQAKEVANRLHAAVECDRVTVFRLDEAEGRLVSVYAEGIGRGEISLGIRLGIAGLGAVTAQDIVVDDVASDPRFDSHVDESTGYLTRSLICLPIKARRGDVLGVVQVINKRDGRFDGQDVEVLRSLVAVFAVFIENAMLFADQDAQFHSMLEVMAASIDAKDHLTAGHSRNVAEISQRIGHALGFSVHELEVLKVAALLHDYGKIGISDAVLKKEGKLTSDEYAHIKHHAKMTHGILEKIYFARKYRAVPLVAASHHEYLDGSGYPQGLTSKQIPFMSKILTVADVFEALTADRHYRKGMSPAQAISILREGVGTRFDANVLTALEQTLESGDAAEVGLAGARAG